MEFLLATVRQLTNARLKYPAKNIITPVPSKGFYGKISHTS